MLNTKIQYRCIGKGFCGSVWSLEGDGQDDVCEAVKREDGGPGRSVTNDYSMHLRVLRSALERPSSMPLSILQCHDLVQSIDPWWQQRLDQFPAGHSACRALISERTPKYPDLLVTKSWIYSGNAPLSAFVKGNIDDDSCSIRPYLGRRHRHGQEANSLSRFQRFSVRNAPLHMDQMESLGLDTSSYAETMAEALALMYWGANVDANDVEFVLAPSRRDVPSTSSVFQSEYLGIHCMWILDFDCCQPLSMDEAGIERACSAFFKNDPFYPKPGSGEAANEAIWKVFKHRFSVATRRFLNEECFLAEKLLERIEEEGRLRRVEREKLISGE